MARQKTFLRNDTYEHKQAHATDDGKVFYLKSDGSNLVYDFTVGQKNEFIPLTGTACPTGNTKFDRKNINWAKTLGKSDAISEGSNVGVKIDNKISTQLYDVKGTGTHSLVTKQPFSNNSYYYGGKHFRY